ncbi:MAG: hypothetical protein NC548_57410 [Lachnospiraceae bacterium]|nr:hypothetical protein [Lachnospiraceae bacterium]
MADYHSGAKHRKRRVGAGNIQSAAVQVRPSVAKAALSKTMPEKVLVEKPRSARGKVATARLINSMDLDEMLEASKVVEMGIKGEKIPAIKSSKAQKYAGTILQLNKRSDTKPMAEKMMHDLNVQIIRVNRKTTNAVESKRLYRELMAEE